MGILPLTKEHKNYVIEFDAHKVIRPTELPVEKLGAVFIETGGAHPENREEMARFLHDLVEHAHYIANDHNNEQKGAIQRILEIVQRARTSGTEIWFVDIETTNEEVVRELRTSKHRITRPIREYASYWLARRGNATRRKVSRYLIKRLEAASTIGQLRELTINEKIRLLSEKSGHNNIGIFVGAAHAGLEDIIKKGLKLNEEQKRELAKKGAHALKAYRCIYDSQAGNWRVEEHSL